MCALVELRNERLDKVLDPPQWMQIVNVNLFKTETSWATRVAMAGWKQAIDLDISAMPPSEAADNFLMHLWDSPAGPDEFARYHIHRTIPQAASGSACIPPQVSMMNSKYVSFRNARPGNPQSGYVPYSCAVLCG